MIVNINGTDVDTDALYFRKSSHSQSGSCVETAFVDAGVLVRDSKDKGGPVLAFTPDEWDAWLKGVRDHEFDL